MRTAVLVALSFAASIRAAGAASVPDPSRAERESVMIRTVLDVADADWRLGRLDSALRLLDAMLSGTSREYAAPADLAALTLERARLLSAQASLKGEGQESAITESRRALAEAAASGDAGLQATAQDRLGMALYMREIGTSAHEEAAALFAESLATRRRLKEQRGVAETLFHLGLTRENRVAPSADDLAIARKYYQEALGVAETGGFGLEASYAYRHLAGLRDEAGDLDGARRFFEKSLELREETGTVILVPPALIALADVLVKTGERARAAACYERAAHVAAEIGATRLEATARAALAKAKIDRP